MNIGRVGTVNSATQTLYAFMSDPTVQYSFDLQNGDIIRVKPINKPMDTYVALQGKDKIHILDQATYSDVANISVNGQVRRPFSRELAFGDRLTVSQALDLAGGLKPSVYPVAYIFRKNLLNPVEVTYIRIELDKSGDTPLQPYDQLVVRMTPNFTLGRTVELSGQVKYPGTYVLESRQTTLAEVIKQAGGFQKNADRNSVVVINANNQVVATTRFLIFFRVSPRAQPGATIAMRMAPEKVEAELKPEEKMDFETTVSKTLSVLTSTLSIILLVKSLNN